MATDTEQLVVLLEARIADFERNMRKANATAEREFGAIERRGRQSAQRVEGLFSQIGRGIKNSVSGFSGGLLAGGIAGLVSQQTIQQLGQVVKSVADMADEAARIDLPVEDLQTLVFSARQAGVEQGKVTDLFQKFNVEIGEAATKGNDLGKILAANGVAILDANGKIRDQKDLFFEVVRLIQSAKTQQEAAVIAMAAFGKGAADALPWLQQGAEAIKAGEQAARDSGAVISKELVEAAQRFDDAWTAAWDTWTAKGKSAILSVATELEDLWHMVDAAIASSGITSEDLRGSGLIPGLNNTQIGELEALFPSLKPSDQQKIVALQKQETELTAERARLEAEIAKMREVGMADFKLEETQQWLDDTLAKLEEVKQKLREISLMNGPTWEQMGRGTGAMPSTIIPDLGKATEDLKEGAKTFTEAAQEGILPLISQAEGTSGPNGYNTSLGLGRFTGGEQNLTAMTLRDVLALQRSMLQHPDNHFTSSALGKHQIVSTTLKGLISELGLSLDELFTPELQDKLGAALVARRGSDPNALRAEWQGLQRVGDADIGTAMANSSSTIEAGTAAINQQRTALEQLSAAQMRENDALRVQAQTQGMSVFDAARLTKEHELLAQAQQSGITITDAVRNSISALASEYAMQAQSIDNVRQSQQQAAKSAEQMAQSQQQITQMSGQLEIAFAGATSGFLSDLMAGKKASDALRDALARLADQLISMATNQIFSMIFSGGAKGKGGLGILGFASGGRISGRGTGTSDSIPIMASNGEFIVRASEAEKHHRLLTAINDGELAGFAGGGLVGKPKLDAPKLSGANVQTNNFAVNTTVNATGGDKEQNDDLARRVSEHVEGSMRALIVREIMVQKKPGNLLGR